MSDADAKSIFLAAIERYRSEDWPAFLDEACAGDQQLRGKVEKLLRGHRKMGTFKEHPDGEVLATERSTAAGEQAVETEIGPYKIREQLGEGAWPRQSAKS